MSAPEFRRWVEKTTSASPLVRFRIAFAAIWLVYDILDVALGGTRGSFWSVGDPSSLRILLGSQLSLIAIEAALLIGWRPRLMAFLAFAARAFEARLFMLNDFLYYCVAALLLANARTAGSLRKGPAEAQVPAWPRDVFVLQTAWVYFATALLKLNTPWLSGGDLYVRQNYLAAAHHWLYPGFYARWISGLGFNSTLAWMACFFELTLSVVLLLWWLKPKHRPLTGRLATALVVGIHGFAALALNVYFFGASMISQVALLTWTGKKRENS
jgi:hypothetical protein